MTEIHDTPELRALWADTSLTVPRIADRLGCGSSTLDRIVRKFGYPRRYTGVRRPKNSIVISDETFTAAWNDPQSTLRSISDRFDIHPSSVRRRAIRLGLVTRRAVPPSAAVADEPEAAPAPPRPPSELALRIGVDFYDRLVATSGAYADLADLAAERGTRMQSVQAMYHRVRVEA